MRFAVGAQERNPGAENFGQCSESLCKDKTIDINVTTNNSTFGRTHFMVILVILLWWQTCISVTDHTESESARMQQFVFTSPFCQVVFLFPFSIFCLKFSKLCFNGLIKLKKKKEKKNSGFMIL